MGVLGRHVAIAVWLGLVYESLGYISLTSPYFPLQPSNPPPPPTPFMLTLTPPWSNENEGFLKYCVFTAQTCIACPESEDFFVHRRPLWFLSRKPQQQQGRTWQQHRHPQLPPACPCRSTHRAASCGSVQRSAPPRSRTKMCAFPWISPPRFTTLLYPFVKVP